MTQPSSAPNLDHPILRVVKKNFPDKRLHATEYRGQSTLIVEPESISQLLEVNATFIVEGSAGDAVSSTTTWSLGTPVAGYTVYTFGAITLQVNNAVSQTIPIN